MLEVFEPYDLPRAHVLGPIDGYTAGHRYGFVSLEFRRVHHTTTPTLLRGTMHGGVVQERMEGREGPLEAFRSFSEAIQHPDP